MPKTVPAKKCTPNTLKKTAFILWKGFLKPTGVVILRGYVKIKATGTDEVRVVRVPSRKRSPREGLQVRILSHPFFYSVR